MYKHKITKIVISPISSYLGGGHLVQVERYKTCSTYLEDRIVNVYTIDDYRIKRLFAILNHMVNYHRNPPTINLHLHRTVIKFSWF